MTKPAPEIIEDLEFLDSTNVGAFAAAERTGFRSAEALEKWLARHDAYDLWLSFKKRDPAGVHAPEARRAANQPNVGMSRIDALLARASKSPHSRTRKKGERIAALIDELAAVLDQQEAADAQREEARKEVERLERKLAEARAMLRGAKPAATTGGTVRSITPGDFPCRLGCDERFTTGQGRSAHERRSAAHRDEAAS